MNKISERETWKVSGFLMFLVELVLPGLFVYLIAAFSHDIEGGSEIVLGVVCLALFGFCINGFFVVQPNEARVLVFFGTYVGSVVKPGFWWSNPLTVKKHVLLRIRNFNSDKLKVNDSQGNPIEIAAVVVWRVVDSAKALFDVENFETFVAIQSETAIRALATAYPYDSHEEEGTSLRGSPDEIADKLRQEVQKRLLVAGVEVMEARINHLAYAPEIAQAMLRRQQAQAVIAARQKIVEGAVGMVDMAIRMLSEQKVIVLDEEKKATMVNNLLVALVSEQEVSPVINTGSLYT
ncbi:MAG: SPFH domain-containing protein [Bacteroidetes bacterium]|nr:SPFH domain-containing protein [Bacteroidota bacterium]